MSDLDDLMLDRAFEALTRDLAHTPGPGAAAAVSTARRRRRTRVGAVALAALVVVGGGLTVPRLVFPSDGVAADGGSARFDTPALAAATEGWIDEWETWERYSPWGGGGFSMASCTSGGGPAGDVAPEPTSRGSSRFVSHSGASAVLVVGHYADARAATSAQEGAATAADTCGSTTTYDVDGVQVVHDSMPPEGESVGDMWLGDIWSVRIGADRADLQLVNDTGVADEETAEDVAEALVAGLRDGWTQSGMEAVQPQPASRKLPEWPDDVDLDAALAGWESPTERAPTTSPNLLCLHDRLNGPSTSTSGGGGSERGVSYIVAGYDDPTGGTANVELVLDQLRACSSTDIRLEALPNGVHLATYDTGGPEPENAIWIAANGDRAGMVAVERAAGPMPASARQDVADALVEILHTPWD
jgi:hypothetical protein